MYEHEMKGKLNIFKKDTWKKKVERAEEREQKTNYTWGQKD